MRKITKTPLNQKRSCRHAHHQMGYTLLELIVALVLGVLITAAAGQLLISSQINLSLQRANSDVQDSSNFGLNYISSDIRKANSGVVGSLVLPTLLHGGVVLTAGNVESSTPLNIQFLTSGLLNNSNTNIRSDQLTIQYQVKQNGVFDCEGNSIPLDNYVVQRYFLRVDDSAGAEETNDRLALACKAANYSVGTTDNLNAATTGLAGNGQIIARRVDQFRVRLGVASGRNNALQFGVMDIGDYMALAEPRPRIISVQLGMIIRSSDSVGNNTLVQAAPTYRLFNQDNILDTPTNNTVRFLRDVVVQTIALRNGIGAAT